MATVIFFERPTRMLKSHFKKARHRRELDVRRHSSAFAGILPAVFSNCRGKDIMLRHPSDYTEIIEARIARAATLAKDCGFDVRCAPSFLQIVSDSASASLLFRYDHIFLEEIAVRLSRQRRYHGSDILNIVIAIANQADLRLELIAESPLRPNVLDLSQRALQAWYRRHQFVDVDEHLMYRLPSSAVEQSPLGPQHSVERIPSVTAPSP